MLGDGLLHGVEHLRMLPHAHIVVRAPDGHILHRVAFIAARAGEVAGAALQFREDAIVAGRLQRLQAFGEELLEIHALEPDHPLWSNKP
jgi:hypothetical protein